MFHFVKFGKVLDLVCLVKFVSQLYWIWLLSDLLGCFTVFYMLGLIGLLGAVSLFLPSSAQTSSPTSV